MYYNSGYAGPAVAKFSTAEKDRVTGEQLVSKVHAEAWHRSQRDSRVQDVFAAWSACMAEAGYDYQAPMEANDDLAWQTTEVTAREIAVATADVACKQKTDLVAVWSGVEAELQAGLVAENKPALDGYRGALGRQVSEARQASR